MKRMVKSDEGRKYPLVPREVVGEEPCTGEAHSNPWIDNCALCAPKWGVMPVYKPVDVIEATNAGYAVPLADLTDEEFDAANAMFVEGLVKRVHVTEKRCSCTGSYYVFVSV